MADKKANNQKQEVTPDQTPLKLEDFMDRPIKGRVPIKFGVTLGDTHRRKAYKAAGLSDEQIKAKMKEHKRVVKGEVDLTGMTFRKFVNDYALQKMAIEIRTGLYPIADAAPSLEEADRMLDDYTNGDEPLVWPWDNLAESPWNETGRKRVDPLTKVNRAVANVADEDLDELLKRIEAEKARRAAAKAGK